MAPGRRAALAFLGEQPIARDGGPPTRARDRTGAHHDSTPRRAAACAIAAVLAASLLASVRGPVTHAVRCRLDDRMPPDTRRRPRFVHSRALRQVRAPGPDARRRAAVHRRLRAARTRRDAYPILLLRTPYCVAPVRRRTRTAPALGPDASVRATTGYIFVYQDVRGRYMSEGEFVNMRPHVAGQAGRDRRRREHRHLRHDRVAARATSPNHNGRVGHVGHLVPRLLRRGGHDRRPPGAQAPSRRRRRSPTGACDDFHHHGALFLPHAFNFMAELRPAAARADDRRGAPRFDHGTPDGYQFFLELGPLTNADERYFKDEIAFWNEIVDAPELRRVLAGAQPPAAPQERRAGGDDRRRLVRRRGPLRPAERSTARSSSRTRAIYNMLVMGPWRHGGWARRRRRRARRRRTSARRPRRLLPRADRAAVLRRTSCKGEGELDAARGVRLRDRRATAGARFDAWPPRGGEPRRRFYLQRRRRALVRARRPADADGLRRVRQRPRQAGAVHRGDRASA